MRHARRVRGTMLLAAGCTAVLAGAATMLARPHDTPAALSPAAFDLPEPERSPDAPWDAPSAAPAGQQTLARPVFSSTRRPFEPPPPDAPIEHGPEATEPGTEPEEAVSLAGIFISGSKRQALLIHQGSPQGVWAVAGATVGGLTVERIDTASVALSGGRGPVILQLRVDNVGREAR